MKIVHEVHTNTHKNIQIHNQFVHRKEIMMLHYDN